MAAAFLYASPELLGKGLVVIDGALSTEQVTALRREMAHLQTSGRLRETLQSVRPPLDPPPPTLEASTERDAVVPIRVTKRLPPRIG
eukprot:2738666-Pyramimonas_sp.AAC.1